MNKVVMITGSFPPDKCGVGDYTKLLCDELSKDYNINVISSYKNKNSDYIINDEIKDWSIKNIFQVMKIITEINPKIVHIQYPTRAYKKKIMVNIIPFILRIKGFFVITTVHEYSTNSFLGKMRTLLNIIGSNCIIVVDPRYIQDLKKFKIFNRKLHYINIASNIPKSNLTIQGKNKFKEKLNLNSKISLIGYFGFINPSKGIESILEAMYQLKRNNKLNSKLLIIGELYREDRYHQSIKEIIDKYELNNDIVITGYLKDSMVAKYISICNFFVLPFVDGYSPKNGSCLAALQEGKKVITTFPKLKVYDSENLIFIDRFDNINQLVEEIDKLQNTCQDNNLEEDSIFTWGNVGIKHKELYEKHINK